MCEPRKETVEAERRRELYREATRVKALSDEEKEKRARTYRLQQLFSDWMWYFGGACMSSIEFGRAAYIAGYERAALDVATAKETATVEEVKGDG